MRKVLGGWLMVGGLLLGAGCGDKGGSSEEGDTWTGGDSDTTPDCLFTDCEADYPVIFDASEAEGCWEEFECEAGERFTPASDCQDTEPVCFTHCTPLAWYEECQWDERCLDACEHIYDADDCAVVNPGKSEEELKNTCFQHCIDAAVQPGEAGDYTPQELPGSSASVSLDNRAQVELWLECLEVKTCEELNDGYCAPIW